MHESLSHCVCGVQQHEKISLHNAEIKVFYRDYINTLNATWGNGQPYCAPVSTQPYNINNYISNEEKGFLRKSLSFYVLYSLSTFNSCILHKHTLTDSDDLSQF